MKGFINTAHDRDNLLFLMACDQESLADWFAHTGTDDLDYAWELLTAYSLELAEQATELTIEAELALRATDPRVTHLIRRIAE